jgi:hypothetical protein
LGCVRDENVAFVVELFFAISAIDIIFKVLIFPTIYLLVSAIGASDEVGVGVFDF